MQYAVEQMILIGDYILHDNEIYYAHGSGYYYIMAEYNNKYTKWKKDKEEFAKIFLRLVGRDLSLEIVSYL
jgi:hypothetical protein